MTGADGFADSLRFQSMWCARLGSPLYESLLERAAADVESAGPVRELLAGHGDDPRMSMLALRMMGAVHRLVLEGGAPELVPFYGSVGGSEPVAGAWSAFRSVVANNLDRLRSLIHRGVQTNEVGRSASLVGGFLTVARATGLPLRILETGASAGLNLRWDRFRYEARGATWGPPDSPVRLCDYNSERPLPFDVEAQVVDRAGCDRAPVDPTTEDGRLTLLSYVWPDQVGRIRLLRGALDLATGLPAPVETADAPGWLAARTHTAAPGVATVVFHSIFMQYLDPEGLARFVQIVEEAGARATKEAPVAWLRMEHGDPVAETRLTIWPGGRERLIATSSHHGAAVRWLL